ncbi:peptidoglycan D,D-transpeptidase FtsI family protein [Enorma phocaeensis]|uniref:peptidoglycan D,D-transpeptidase FtsI family protein n=1 Tax=Enorma phocaeensis TaxID=1871019 RepID=UPI0032093751
MPSGSGRDGRAGRPSRVDRAGSARARGASSRRQREGQGGAGGSGSGRPPRPPRAGGSQVDLLHSDLDRERIPRRNFVMGLFGFGVAWGVSKLVDYQIVNVDEYRRRADERRAIPQTLFAKRGTIYDRNGNVITSSVECQNVYVNPQLIEDEDEAVAALVELLGVDEETCREKVGRDTTFAYIKRQVDQEIADALAERNIKGIEYEQTMKRIYPYGNLASQVIGVVNIDNEGVSGLESYYEDKLQGVNGSLVRERARDGSYIAGGAYERVPAQDGEDLVLTLDVNIQSAAEKALAEAVESSGANYGSILVMDPQTGEIFAACSNPTYDQTDLANTAAADMNLRAVTDAYEPGSVFKALVTGMGIDMGTFTTESTFDVPARVKVGDDWVTDVDERDYGMTMTVREIMRRSSNTGMVLLGEQIGADAFAEYLDTYGIGHKSGIDFPGESTGIVRERSEYDGSTLGSMSFGQGIAVSPIEVARAVASIASGGVAHTPHFLKSHHGEEVDWSDGDTETISAEAAEAVTSMMVTVVDEGTGSGGQVAGYDVAGKTGTAERASEEGGYQENNFMASFMGFAPASDPKALVYVTLDGTAGSGGGQAAPPFAAVMAQTLSILGVDPTR